ncbi:1-aminocyclopropane-1-carboxylate deaminase/D-cysteine desulfhydrase [Pedobacter sp. SL55]|uniref:1-aminocyclopropane-1-carboxylate deaminase/D-cysteine desulfhydrase n=1 Tax=Pedobacter sp. SL55 TaxID=2995161 RepID=UPI00226E559C|nr:pyridoxal-phosphate dependent enzyme [Pedobacter sp. SL55]WAC40802.1 pyridoxal-phosphate dependent enzyme [Pedobacter sp. SL55]
MQLPSPIHQVTYNNHTFFIKRDDLIDSFVSGNKWRKLKYILLDAAAKNKKHLVTFGGAYSNHLLATAAAAAKHQLKATAFVRGEEVSNEMLSLCKIFGMRLHFVSRESYRNKLQLFEANYGNDEDAYFINEGGASAEAIIGCAEIIAELPQPFDHIFCAAGTGTTAAGLLKGINQLNLNTQLHVIPVLKGGNFIAEEIARFKPNLTKLHLHTDYHFGGYAKTTRELIFFIKDFTAKTGILLDPIYTGKMCFAINDLIAKNQISKEAKILAIHTGGLFGILGKLAEFDK